MSTSTTPVRFILGGHLGARFGTEWMLHLSQPSFAEAIRAVNANTKGELRRLLFQEGQSQHYQVCLGNEENALERSELSGPSGGQTLYLIPVVQGAENAFGKILAAVAIAVLTYYTAGAVAAWLGTSTTVVATVGYGAAASLFIGGVIQLLTPIPSFNSPSASSDQSHGTIFGGTSTQVAQGEAVPLVYGRALVAPVPVSLSYTAIDQAIVNSYAPQEYTTVIGEGGIITYVPISTNPEDNLPPPNQTPP